MKQAWIEVWRDGANPANRRCTIEETVEGYALDVFRGDTCLYTAVYRTHEEAVRAALDEALKHRIRVWNESLDRSVAEALSGCVKAANSRSNGAASAAA